MSEERTRAMHVNHGPYQEQQTEYTNRAECINMGYNADPDENHETQVKQLARSRANKQHLLISIASDGTSSSLSSVRPGSEQPDTSSYSSKVFHISEVANPSICGSASGSSENRNLPGCLPLLPVSSRPRQHLIAVPGEPRAFELAVWRQRPSEIHNDQPQASGNENGQREHDTHRGEERELRNGPRRNTPGVHVEREANFGPTKTVCLTRCLPVLLVFLGIVAVSMVIAYLFQPKPLYATGTFEMKLNDTFRPGMNDISSQGTQRYIYNICKSLTEEVKKQSAVTRVDDCTVKKLSPGSVVVFAVIKMQTSWNMTKEDFQKLLIESGTSDQEYTSFGTIRAKTSTIQAKTLTISTTEYEEQLIPVPATPSAPTTDLTSPKTLTTNPTDFSSDLTSPKTLTTNPTFSSSDLTSSKVLSTQPTSFSSETTVCSSIDPRILEISIYSCNATKTQEFIPRNDTFPNKCDTWAWCMDGKVVSTSRCALGTHFVWADNSLHACANSGDKHTFCTQMEIAQKCKR